MSAMVKAMPPIMLSTICRKELSMASFVRVYPMRANEQTVVTSHAHSIHVSELQNTIANMAPRKANITEKKELRRSGPSLCASCTRM